MPKKINYDDRINLRVSSSSKKEFMRICEKRNIHYQQVLRKMIDDFIKEPQNNDERAKRLRYLETERLL